MAPRLVILPGRRAGGRTASRFAAEVRDLFAGRVTGDVCHVGSTSIPGLPAKPIIDGFVLGVVSGSPPRHPS